jgi:pimeloyl-ACP methyl ester carboxylesterase
MLVMGLGAQMVLWPDELCRDIAAAGFHVIRFDNRDVGLSTMLNHHGRPKFVRTVLAARLGLRAKVPYTLDDMARDAVGLLDALNIQRAHWVGASMGGMIAQVVAAKFPERVLSLGLIMTTSGDPKLPQAKLHIQLRLIRKPPANDREAQIHHSMKTWRMIGSPAYPLTDELLRTKVERSYTRNADRRGSARQLMAILASGSRVPILRRIQAPTLVVHGAQDPLVPVAAAHDLGKHIPGARVEIIPGMGHDLPPELVPQIGSLLVTHARNAPAAQNR